MVVEYDQVIAFLDDPEHAVRPSPGKFEGNEDLRIARTLHDLAGQGEIDDQLGSVDEGMWLGLIGRFLVQEDTQGFFSYEVFETSDAARFAFLGHGSEEE